MLRENCQFYAILIYYLCQFEEAKPTFGFEAKYFAASALQRILNDVMIDAAQQFRITQAIKSKR